VSNGQVIRDALGSRQSTLGQQQELPMMGSLERVMAARAGGPASLGCCQHQSIL